MSKRVFLVFPHQLFETATAFAGIDEFWLIEDELFFLQLPFHRKKLAFHRASMKYYAEKLRNEGKSVQYFDYKYASLPQIFEKLVHENAQVACFDPTDFLLEKRLHRLAIKQGLSLEIFENPAFYNTRERNQSLAPQSAKKFFMAEFYKKQRLHFDILLAPDAQPIAGRWSFDTENRKALPKNQVLPAYPTYHSTWSAAAEQEITEQFAANPGDPSLAYYPVTHAQAKEALAFFIAQGLENFGPYQDAFTTQAPYVYHSNLSTAINVGLLRPQEVIAAVEAAYHQGKVSIESAEGFIRQVLGWREYMRAVYEQAGVQQRTRNFMQHQRKLDWQALRQLSFLQDVATKLDDHAYAHHIERLMLLGNFFFLSELHPDSIYEFFMCNFMDAYDWVMVPNVYGMSQFADGGLMTTKPYFSSSNYLKKQGFKFDADGAALFDALFWHFVDKHQDYLRKNLRTSQMVANWNRLAPEKKAAHLERAALYFKNLDSFTA
jgi:deoxyribodipyrimidine photolyase-related protein